MLIATLYSQKVPIGSRLDGINKIIVYTGDAPSGEMYASLMHTWRDSQHVNIVGINQYVIISDYYYYRNIFNFLFHPLYLAYVWHYVNSKD